MFFKKNFTYTNLDSSYSNLLLELDTGKVQSLYFYPRRREVDVIFKNGDKEKIPILYNDQLILEKASENKVELTIHNSKKDSSTANSLSSLVILLIFIFSFILLFRTTSKIANRAFGFGKSRSKFIMIDDVDKRFDDVAGLTEATEELQEIITFLKNPQKLSDLGAIVPKGVLMVGPPGTGKTLLAKAIAGESGVPFLSISASEFVELFVGVGASRVRDLFEKAKEKSPCIVFIDEIDSIGRQRGSGIGGGNDEREQTLNQLLTQLDGFSDNSGVIVLAATNRADILDPALLRPGRFDRKIQVLLPDNEGRKKILCIHSLNKPLSKDVDLKYWASRTIGFSGADLENLMNESAIHCARNFSKEINNEHIEDALEKITLGLITIKVSGEKAKKIRAYNEAGRAIVSAVNNGINSIDKITILQRSGSLGGYTQISPDEEVLTSGLISKKSLLNKIEIALAGRAAEILIFGKNEITQLASRDIAYSTEIAKEMITKYGFSSIGPVNISQNNEDIFLGNSLLKNKSSIADKTSLLIDKEIMKITKRSLDKSIKILDRNRLLLDKLVDLLVHEETINREKFCNLSSKSLKV